MAVPVVKATPLELAAADHITAGMRASRVRHIQVVVRGADHGAKRAANIREGDPEAGVPARDRQRPGPLSGSHRSNSS